MSGLQVCSGCSRHVRASERACPFCNSTQLESGTASASGRALSRAAIVFASTTSILGCGKTEKVDPPIATTDAMAVADAGLAIAVAYGPAIVATADAEPTTPPPLGSEPAAGDVIIGTAKMAGNLRDADRLIRGVKGRLRACYIRGLVKSPAMSGKVTLSVKVAANGEVLSSEVAQNSGIDELPAACMAAVLKRVQFDAPGGTGASFTLPLTLVRGDAGVADAAP